jgi:hypothetical protein
MVAVAEELSVSERLSRIESVLAVLVDRATVREWYEVEEVAKLFNKRPYTVREWCRLGRVNGEKRGSGRGAHQQWVISHMEVERIRREGLLPRKPN